MLGLIKESGIKRPKHNRKQDFIIQSEKNPACLSKNDIDYNKSLHTFQLQRSEYIKLDDNLLQFDFDKHFGIPSNPNLKTLTDE